MKIADVSIEFQSSLGLIVDCDYQKSSQVLRCCIEALMSVCLNVLFGRQNPIQFSMTTFQQTCLI